MAHMICAGAMTFSAPRAGSSAVTSQPAIGSASATDNKGVVVPTGRKVVTSWYDAGLRLTADKPAAEPISRVALVQSWYDAGLRLTPDVAVPAAAEPAAEAPAHAQDLVAAPAGFVWGETFVFDDAGTASLVGKVVPVKTADAPTSKADRQTSSEAIDLTQLILKERIGEGTQSEVSVAGLGHSCY